MPENLIFSFPIQAVSPSTILGTPDTTLPALLAGEADGSANKQASVAAENRILAIANGATNLQLQFIMPPSPGRPTMRASSSCRCSPIEGGMIEVVCGFATATGGAKLALPAEVGLEFGEHVGPVR